MASLKLISARSQADGSIEINMGVEQNFPAHQVQIEVSAVPASGTLKIEGRLPNATAFEDLGATIDLVAGPRIVVLEGNFSHLKFTPVGFDADKTWSGIIKSNRIYKNDPAGTAGGSGGTQITQEKDYAQRIDKVSDTVMYVGKASPLVATSTAAWLIKRVTFDATTGMPIDEYASNAYDQVWDNRASLSYS